MFWKYFCKYFRLQVKILKICEYDSIIFLLETAFPSYFQLSYVINYWGVSFPSKLKKKKVAVIIKQDGLHTPLSLTKVQTGLLLMGRHQTSLFLKHLFSKICNNNSFSTPLRYKYSFCLMPVLQPRIVLLKDLGAILKCNPQKRVFIFLSLQRVRA